MKLRRPLIHIIKYWLPVVVWALVIFTFSSKTAVKTSEIHWQDFAVKKLAHLTEYAIFATLLYRALKTKIPKKNAMIYSVLIAGLYGFTDEFHQSFTPGREPTIRDAIIDTIGASIALTGIWKLLPKAPKTLTNLAKKLDLL